MATPACCSLRMSTYNGDANERRETFDDEGEVMKINSERKRGFSSTKWEVLQQETAQLNCLVVLEYKLFPLSEQHRPSFRDKTATPTPDLGSVASCFSQDIDNSPQEPEIGCRFRIAGKLAVRQIVSCKKFIRFTYRPPGRGWVYHLRFQAP